MASVVAHAEPVVREAEFALETCDTHRGLAMLQALADRGDAVAQRQLGTALHPTDAAAAERWYRTAFETRAEKARLERAEAGDVEAQYLLAAYYGSLIGSNYAMIKKAQIAWTRVFPAIKAAAESGDLRAQERLAKMYLYGRGVPENKAEAEKWYRTIIATLAAAAEKGELGAMLRLDDMAAQDKPGSAAAAAVQGCVPAQAMVALRLQQRDYPRKPDRRARLQASVWWTILVRNTDPQYERWVNLARDCLATNKLDADEQALVQAKAVRCVQSGYAACD